MHDSRNADRVDCTPQFRADADRSGRWFVWESVGDSGWATVVSCPSRLDAVRLAEQLNSSPVKVLGAGDGEDPRHAITSVLDNAFGRLGRLA